MYFLEKGKWINSIAYYKKHIEIITLQSSGAILRCETILFCENVTNWGEYVIILVRERYKIWCENEILAAKFWCENVANLGENVIILVRKRYKIWCENVGLLIKCCCKNDTFPVRKLIRTKIEQISHKQNSFSHYFGTEALTSLFRTILNQQSTHMSLHLFLTRTKKMKILTSFLNRTIFVS